MTKIGIKLALLLGALTVPFHSSADQQRPPSIEWLSAKPATMLDIGVVRLGLGIQSNYSIKRQFPDGSFFFVTFDYTNHNIVIGGTSPTALTNEDCSRLWVYLRDQMFLVGVMNISDPKVTVPWALQMYFSSHASPLGEGPKELWDDLERHIVIEVGSGGATCNGAPTDQKPALAQ